MSRAYNPVTINILKFLSGKQKAIFKDIKAAAAAQTPSKDFYNYLFRLAQSELIEKTDNTASITEEGKKLLLRLAPKKDGIWKIIIFDIPEKHKYVRVVLRAKLKQLHFKKWQNSIWISPYELEGEIEQELTDLGKKYFVRLIKTTEINHCQDLEKMFY